MTGFEPTIAGAGKWAIARGYEWYTTLRLEHALERAGGKGLTVSELSQSEHRFALFVRMVRALEVCSQNEVVDYIADVLIGSVRLEIADDHPDLAQMAIAALSGVTKLELNLILLMREHHLWGRTDEEVRADISYDAFYDDVESRFDLDKFNATAILNSLIKTGLVTPQASGYGNVVTVQGNRLTRLAEELFRYVDYAKRLTV